MKTNLKTKVMLAVLAGGMLCANGAFAEEADYTIKQGNVKGDSGITGNYSSVIQGNTAGSGLTVSGGTLSAASYTGNEIIIRRGTYSKDVRGANSIGSDDVTNNKVTVYDGTVTCSPPAGIYGGYSSSGSATNNSVIINYGTFNGVICGGAGNNASGNEVVIKGGTINKNVYGCRILNGPGTAEGNIVTINGGTFSSGVQIYGGSLISGGSSIGNILNLNTKIGGRVGYVKYFQTMNFTLPAGIQDGDTMLSTGGLAVNGGGGVSATVNVYAANGVKLKAGDVITLIQSDSTSDTFVGGDVLGGAGAVIKSGNNLILTLNQNFEQKSGGADQQKAPVEGVAAAAVIVNAGADLASGEGMASLVANTAGGATDTFGAMSAGSSKYKTGSHVDVDGWGFLVGAGKTKEWKNGTATTYGLFFEYGKGDFDTYNGNVHGDGNSENKGIGIMARHKLTNNTYYEGNIRFGKQETEWSQSELGGYDTDSRYYGISVGVGHIYPVGKNEIDVYGRYTYGHVGACDATLKDSKYHFDSVKSHRVRVGGKYNFKVKDSNAKPYVGLAWEREFKGEARASISGVGEAPAPSMKGNTGILEVGCDWNVSKKWTVGLGANAYMGKRKGWDGMARVFYNF